MDIAVIGQIMEGIKQVATDYQGLLGGFAGVLLTVYAIYQKYQAVVAEIALRIEKDTADGDWTNEEKEQAAVDIYFYQIVPQIPITLILLKMVLARRFLMEPVIRRIVRTICAKAGKLQKVV